MIGDMISRVRKERGMTKTELAKLVGVNIGHITHIEKGERNPSQKTLKLICKALDIPYQQLMYTLGKTLNESQEDYNFIQYVSYDKILAVDAVDKFIDCPAECPGASIAFKMQDNCMEPAIKKGQYVFVEFNSPLDNKDFGLFSVNEKIIIRRFSLKRGKICLMADNKNVNDIFISDSDNFFIIGKIIG